MKVVYVSKALVSAAYRDKIRALSAHADVCAVIPDRWGSHPVEPLTDGEPIRPLPVLLHGHNHLHVYRGLGAVLDRERPDLVHIDEEPYSAAAYQIARLCISRRIPSLVFAWQNLDKRLPTPFRQMRRSVFRMIAGAIAGTERAAEVLARAGCARPIAVIPQFGVDPERFRPDPQARAAARHRLNARDGEFVVGFGGRLVKEKGVHLLLEAVRPLADTRLVFVGEGPERDRLARAARDTGIHERVHFTGAVGSTKMPNWISAFDALVLPSIDGNSWREQFGRILIEAMACGVPVIGSSSGEIPRVIGDGGRVFPEGDAGALTTAIRDLANSNGHRAQLGRAGRERVRALYTQDRIADATAAFYRSLLGSPS